MECADCRCEMIPYKVRQIALDVCPQCKGFWFDSGELEKVLLLPDDFLQASFSARERPGGPFGYKGDPRPCPRCSATMEKDRCESIWVDYCTQGHGIWLDAGELQLIYQHVQASRGPLPPSVKATSGNVVTDFASLTGGVLLGPLRQLWTSLRPRKAGAPAKERSP